MGNRNVQLVFETLLQNELNAKVRVLPPMLKPVLQEIIRWFQVARMLFSDYLAT